MLGSELTIRSQALAVALDESARLARDASTTAATDARQEDRLGLKPRKVLPTLEELRRVKAKNVSWQQLLRGGQADLGIEVKTLRKSDKSLARRVARESGITVAELVQVLDCSGITLRR